MSKNVNLLYIDKAVINTTFVNGTCEECKTVYLDQSIGHVTFKNSPHLRPEFQVITMQQWLCKACIRHYVISEVTY